MKIITGNDAVIASPVFSNAVGEPAPCDTDPTVTVVKDSDGSEITAVVGTGDVGAYTASFDAVDAPDLLTLTWVGTVGGETQTFTQQVEVAGGVYVTPNELWQLPDLTPSKHPASMLTEIRDEFEELAERWTGQAWVPRYASERLPYQTHLLGHRLPREILSVTDGDATVVDFSTWDLTTSGLVSSLYGCPFVGPYPYGVKYLHGADRPTAVLVRACKEYVRSEALRAGNRTGRDVRSMTDPAGITTQFSTPDWNAGRPTGWLNVDRDLCSLGAPLPGIA